ncbi:MAG: hypothetical protein CSA70_02750 [Rhodobacterales bacterium]|nr:MAG: hypothetical protein CSA70_02750 [Rhodobacterales bacterium]
MALFSGDLVSSKILLDGAFAGYELDAFQHNVTLRLPNESVMLDIGENIGNHSRVLSQFFSYVFAFEPHPPTH